MFNLNSLEGFNSFSNYVGKEKMAYYKVQDEKLIPISFTDFVRLSQEDKEQVLTKIDNAIIEFERISNPRTVNKIKEIRNLIFYSSRDAIDNNINAKTPKDILGLIASRTSPKDIANLRQVSRHFKQVPEQAVILSINKGKLKLKDVVPPKIKTADEALDWLIAKFQKSHTPLTYANFEGFRGFTDEHVNKLTQNFPYLNSLFINSGKITAIGAQSVARMQNVVTLDLMNNVIGDEGAKEIAKMQNVVTLNLAANQIGDEGAKEIARMQNVATLSLGGNRIGTKGAKEIARMQNVVALNLGANVIGDEGAKEIAKMQNVVKLNLGANGIGDEGAKKIAKMQNVVKLNLGANGIGVEGVKEIAKMQNIVTLNLWDNQINDDGVKEITKMQNVVTLDLRGNLIGDEGKKEIATMLERNRARLSPN